MAKPNKKLEEHEAFKKKHWPTEPVFIPPKRDWIKAPRSLPLLMSLISSKKVSGGRDPSSVYLELLSRRWDSGVVEINNEAEHAFAAGYAGRRGLRTWRERMALLEEVGLIKTKGNTLQRYRYVLLLDPDHAVSKIKHIKGAVTADWLEQYELRRSPSSTTP
jgi:hypothetical protein